MGKIRTKIIGLEDVEKQQKEEAKKRQEAKKTTKKKENTEESIEKTESKENTRSSGPKSGMTKGKKKTTETKSHVRGKNYLKAAAVITGIATGSTNPRDDKSGGVDIGKALDLLKKMKYANFDETVEVHINVDATGLKGDVDLPHGTGKKTRVKVVDDNTIDEIANNKIDFDVLIAHPSFMPKLARYAKVLGPKGLMPNPKAGTISTNPEQIVKKFEKGLLRWKTEPKAALIHQAVGKASYDEKALKENIVSLLKSVGRSHIQGAFVKTTMSPAVKLNLKEF